MITLEALVGHVANARNVNVIVRNFAALARLVLDTGGISASIRWGVVADDGTALGGSGGFTVTKTGTGTYTVAQAMPTAPIVVVGAGHTGGAYAAKVSSLPTATGFDVITYLTTTAANADGAFHWIAIG